MCVVVAKMNKKQVEVVIDSDETRAEASYKAFNPTNKFPLLETPEGKLSESHAVAKYLAHGHASLLGANALERAQVDQWMNWVQSGPQQAGYPAIMAIFGRTTECTSAAFLDSMKSIKENLRAVDQGLTGDFLCGSKVTLADIFVAGTFSMAFQTVLDQGFTKAAPKACAWFARVAALPEFVSCFGKIKMAKKALKPILKTEEKPKKGQAAAGGAAKPKGEDAPAKKEVNPLDALPPSSFDMYNFKTYFVNVPDKAGEGHARMMAEVDHEGYSFWFLHYEKFGKEGQVEYQFLNLLEGFMQRLDGFRKHAFGKMCMLKAEPDLEMAGVLLMRGQVIPQECIDHPQFEYCNPRKMDVKNPADVALIKDFFASKDQTGTANGWPVAVSMWHK